MRFRVLGPVDVYDGDERLSLGGAKPRLLLAALLSEPGRVVPADRLIDILWNDSPPETARALIHTYASILRRTLNRSGREALVTRPPGYLVQLDPAELDSAEFQRLVAAAREARREGRLDEAAEAFRAADGLWQGPAYAGEAALASQASRLAELRLSAAEERIAAELELGRANDVVGELTSLVGAHPTHEGLRAQLMVVLYRLGRQAEALASYHHGREVLAEELGIDPGPELRRVHEAILRGDPELLAAAPEAAGPADEDSVPTRTAEPPPAQLPFLPADFVGRTDAVEQLVKRLTTMDAEALAGTTCVIVGRSGTGKSTLAVRVGHGVAASFPDGQLFADLRGWGEHPAQPVEVLGRFLRSLGADPATLPDSLDERADRFRTLLATRRVLVVLDDAADEAQVRPLLPGGAGNAVLVTTRRRLAGLAGAVHEEIDALDGDEAVQLLTRTAGVDRVAREPAQARELVWLCGRLPIAVRIVGARLASRPHWTLTSMVARLADEARRLDELAVADQQVRAGMELTYRGLDERPRAVLRALSWLGLPDFPAWITGPLLDVPASQAEDAVEALVDLHLVTVSRVDAIGQTRYRIHDLVQLYGREQAESDPPQRWDDGLHRLMGTWLWLIARITENAPTGAIPFVTAQPQHRRPDAAVAQPILDQPMAWLEAEQPALVAAVERAAALGLADVSVALATALCGSIFAHGNQFEAWDRTHTAALAAARAASDRSAEAVLLAQLGQLCYTRDDYRPAHQHLLESLTIFRELGDERGEATVQAARGWICREQGRLREALHLLSQAHAYFMTTSLDAAIGYTARLIGTTRLEQGDLAQARADLSEALAAYRRLGSRRGEALVVRSLSLVHRATGRLDDALARALEALAIFRTLGDEKHEAYALQSVAKTLIRLGRGDEALPMLNRALVACEQLGDQWGTAFILRTRGELHLADQRLAEAEEDLNEAIRRWGELDVALMRARAQRDLATLLDARGDHATATEVRRTAMATFQACGAREFSELALQAQAATDQL